MCAWQQKDGHSTTGCRPGEPISGQDGSRKAVIGCWWALLSWWWWWWEIRLGVLPESHSLAQSHSAARERAVDVFIFEPTTNAAISLRCVLNSAKLSGLCRFTEVLVSLLQQRTFDRADKTSARSRACETDSAGGWDYSATPVCVVCIQAPALLWRKEYEEAAELWSLQWLWAG